MCIVHPGAALLSLHHSVAIVCLARHVLWLMFRWDILWNNDQVIFIYVIPLCKMLYSNRRYVSNQQAVKALHLQYEEHKQSLGELVVLVLFLSRCVRFIHLVVCLTTGPKPLPKRALHTVRSRASSFKWEYPLLSLRSSNSFLRLLPCLPCVRYNERN